MKKSLLTIIISVLLSITSVNVFASAAEKWDYEVKPDTNQKLDIKGHKVDVYGNAANDYEYNRKIDPKTLPNRTKMGNVGFGRLLKISGWGLLGTAALEGLLQSVDWVIDPQAQSIWRYKKTDSNGSTAVCYYTYIQNGTNYQVIYLDGYGGEYTCPLDAAKSAIRQYATEQTSLKDDSGKFLRWTTDIASNPRIARYEASFVKELDSTTVVLPRNLSVTLKQQPDARQKEYLTPDQLADYANHTHSDYANPELAPKLEPHYTPSIQTDLWKPANPWEYDNSPTVDQVKKELEQASPEPKDDKIKENEPDPETGAKSFSLPPFCSWATAVCEFIDSFKKEPELKDQQLEIEQQNPINFERKNYVQFGKSCPFAPQQYALPLGIGSIEFEADASVICTYGVIANPYIVALGHLGSLLYLLYALRSGSA